MSTRPTRTERLDNLAFNRHHVRLIAGSGIGWALDAMDVGLISYVIVVLGKQWELNDATKSWVISIGSIGMMLGAAIGGWLADKIGRRTVFAMTLVVYGLATLATAFVPDGKGADVLVGNWSTGLVMMMGLRLLVGIGLGAELPVASTLVSEFAPRRVRGRMVVGLEAFWALGWIFAALLGFLVVQQFQPDGWRWALAVGIVPAIYALVVRYGLPESVRFLESKGRHAEAERSVEYFEGRRNPADDDDVPTAPIAPKGTESIWASAYRTRTAALWGLWFCVNFSYYGAFLWIPSLLGKRGFPINTSFEMTLIMTIAQLPGYAAAAWLIERWGRRTTLATFLAGSAVAAMAFGMADTKVLIIFAGCLLSFFNLGAWGALYAVGPELYPTSVRGTGTGQAAAFGRVASIIAPLLMPVFVAWASGSDWLAFVIIAAMFAIAVIAALMLPEQKHTRLEA